MAGLQRSRRAAGFVCALACLAFSDGARAQERDCAPPAGTIAIGGEIAVVWRMRAGFTCSIRIRIGYRHIVQSISVSQPPRHGRAGASTDRERDEVGRAMIRIAYMSPPRAPAGDDAFTVRVLTRDRDSGAINATLLHYRMELWRE